ncbi:GSCOCG00011813001-RA-CDS [Cotesia congregata]|nr:GSCOCG00011813001-RA-CDS [Cotesia congregata]
MDTNIKLVYYNVKQVKSCYTKLKDKTPLLDQFGIIYKIPCECDKCYVGQTRQHLKKRIAQHKYDCKKIKLVNHNVLLEVEPPSSSTALALHHLNTGHRFKFEDVSMLDQESHWKKRNIGEMCFIKMNNTINKRTDTQNLSSVYNVILNCDRAHSFDGTGM